MVASTAYWHSVWEGLKVKHVDNVDLDDVFLIGCIYGTSSDVNVRQSRNCYRVAM